MRFPCFPKVAQQLGEQRQEGSVVSQEPTTLPPTPSEKTSPQGVGTGAMSGVEFLWGLFLQPQTALVEFVKQPKAPVVALLFGLVILTDLDAPSFYELGSRTDSYVLEELADIIGHLSWLVLVFLGLLVSARPPGEQNLSGTASAGVLCVLLWPAIAAEALGSLLSWPAGALFSRALPALGMGLGLLLTYTALVDGILATPRRSLVLLGFLAPLLFFRLTVSAWVTHQLYESGVFGLIQGRP